MRKFILLLSLALVGSLVFGYFQYQKNVRWAGSKVLYEYDAARDLTITRFKADGKIMDIGYDRNRDLQDDSLVSFATNGQAVHIWVDEDYNGRLEVQYSYDPSGRLAARYEDFGQDGYFEEFVRYSSDSIFVYMDANRDGWCEDSEVVRRQRR